LWPARRTRSRRSSHVVHDTAPIPGIIMQQYEGVDLPLPLTAQIEAHADL